MANFNFNYTYAGYDSQAKLDSDKIHSATQDLSNLGKNLLNNASARANFNAQDSNIPQNSLLQSSANAFSMNLVKNAQNVNINNNVNTQNVGQTSDSKSIESKYGITNIPNYPKTINAVANAQNANINNNTNIQNVNTNSSYNPNVAFSTNAETTTPPQNPQNPTQNPQLPFMQASYQPKSLFQQEKDLLKMDSLSDSSRYSKINTSVGGKFHTFDNHSNAMSAKKNLYDSYMPQGNENDLNELTKQHRIIDEAVDALETIGKTYGKDSETYKKKVEEYLQNPILKENNLIDYASLQKFYESGGYIGGVSDKIAKNSSLDSNTQGNLESNLQDKKYGNFDSAENFIQAVNYSKNAEMNKDGAYKGFLKDSIFGTSENKHTASDGIDFIDFDSMQELAKKDTDIINKSGKFTNKADATLDDTQKALARWRNKGYSTTESEWHNFKKTIADDKKDKIDVALSGVNVLGALGYDTIASTLESADKYFNPNGNGKNKADAFVDSYELFSKANKDGLKGYTNKIIGDGSDNLLTTQYLDIMREKFEPSTKASEAFYELEKTMYEYWSETDSNKKEVLKEKWNNQAKALKEIWENTPAKKMADNEIVNLVKTMENQHDVGRIMNIFKDKEVNAELKQRYANDLKEVLKLHDKFKDIEDVRFNESGQIIVKKGNEYFTADNSGIESFLHALKDSMNEAGFGVAGAIYGAKKGANLGKGMQGKALGAITGSIVGGALGSAGGAFSDEIVNSFNTKYKNPDLGLKRMVEAGALSALGDFLIVGGSKAISALKNGVSLPNTSGLAQKVGAEAQKLLNSNVNATENFLAKNALSQEQRDSIIKGAQDTFLGGRSLNEFKADSSIPKLQRLKAAWQYDKFINKESMRLGKAEIENISKEFEKFQTTSMESNRPIMSVMQDLFEGKSTRAEREKFLRFVSQNEPLKNSITSLLAKNPTLALNFGKFIDKRAADTLKSIETEAISQRMFKDLNSQYDKDLKNRYGRVEFNVVDTLKGIDFSPVGAKINSILDDLEKSIPHVTNAGQVISEMRKRLSERANFLGADDLLNIRKYYNQILRQQDFKNASFKHLQDINNVIDNVVEASLKNLDSQGKPTAKVLKDYKDINKEYAEYAKFRDSKFYKSTIKNKSGGEIELSDSQFNTKINEQMQREKGFNNPVFNRIMANADSNFQAQAVRELIKKNVANPNGKLQAIKWKELVEDLEKIEHSITNENLRNLVGQFKEAKRLYLNDSEFLNAALRSLGGMPANVLISSANGLFGRSLLLFYNFLHKVMSKFAGGISETLAHQALSHQLDMALRYARNTKDFIKITKESLQKMPQDKDVKATLNELTYWDKKLSERQNAAIFDAMSVKEAMDNVATHEAQTQTQKEVFENEVKVADEIIEEEIVDVVPLNSMSPVEKGEFKKALIEYEDSKKALIDSKNELESVLNKPLESVENISKNMISYDSQIVESASKMLTETKNMQSQCRDLIKIAQGNELVKLESISKELVKVKRDLDTLMNFPKDSNVIETISIEELIRAATNEYLKRLAKQIGYPYPAIESKSLANEIKAIPYKINSELKENMRDILTKHNAFSDALKDTQEKATLLLEYKPTLDSKPLDSKPALDSKPLDSINLQSNLLESKPLSQNIESKPQDSITPTQNIESKMQDSKIDSNISQDNLHKHINAESPTQKNIADGYAHAINEYKNPHYDLDTHLDKLGELTKFENNPSFRQAYILQKDNKEFKDLYSKVIKELENVEYKPIANYNIDSLETNMQRFENLDKYVRYPKEYFENLRDLNYFLNDVGEIKPIKTQKQLQDAENLYFLADKMIGYKQNVFKDLALNWFYDSKYKPKDFPPSRIQRLYAVVADGLSAPGAIDPIEYTYKNLQNALDSALDTDKLFKLRKDLDKRIDEYKANKDKMILDYISQYKKPTQDSIESKPITLHTNGIKTYAQLNKEFREAIKPVLNTDITNKQTGIEARISSNEAKKMVSKDAVDKSKANGYTKEQHFKACENIKDLFIESRLRETHADSKNRKEIANVMRFEKEIHFDNENLENKNAIAKITIFEKNQGDNKIYTLELELDKSTPLSNRANIADVVDSTMHTSDAPHHPSGDFIESSKRNDSIESSNLDSNNIESTQLTKEQEKQLQLMYKKQAQIDKLQRQYDEISFKMQTKSFAAKNSNTRSKQQQHAKNDKLDNIRNQIKELQKEVVLLNPYATSREKLFAQYPENEPYARNTMEMLENLKQSKVLSDNDIKKGKLVINNHTMEFYELNNLREWNTRYYDIKPLSEFGTNYAEFYHDGVNAIRKVMAEKQGQVAGAFYRKDLGDIDLVWGVAGSGRSDGYGLAKIVEFHPEVLDKIPEIIEKGKIIKDSKNRLNIELDNDIIGLKDNWMGEKTPNNWIVTSYSKKNEFSKGIDSAKSENTIKENSSFETHKGNDTIESKITQDSINPHENIESNPKSEYEIKDTWQGLKGAREINEAIYQQYSKDFDRQLGALEGFLPNTQIRYAHYLLKNDPTKEITRIYDVNNPNTQRFFEFIVDANNTNVKQKKQERDFYLRDKWINIDSNIPKDSIESTPTLESLKKKYPYISDDALEEALKKGLDKDSIKILDDLEKMYSSGEYDKFLHETTMKQGQEAISWFNESLQNLAKKRINSLGNFKTLSAKEKVKVGKLKAELKKYVGVSPSNIDEISALLGDLLTTLKMPKDTLESKLSDYKYYLEHSQAPKNIESTPLNPKEAIESMLQGKVNLAKISQNPNKDDLEIAQKILKNMQKDYKKNGLKNIDTLEVGFEALAKVLNLPQDSINTMKKHFATYKKDSKITQDSKIYSKNIESKPIKNYDSLENNLFTKRFHKNMQDAYNNERKQTWKNMIKEINDYLYSSNTPLLKAVLRMQNKDAREILYNIHLLKSAGGTFNHESKRFNFDKIENLLKEIKNNPENADKSKEINGYYKALDLLKKHEKEYNDNNVFFNYLYDLNGSDSANNERLAFARKARRGANASIRKDSNIVNETKNVIESNSKNANFKGEKMLNKFLDSNGNIDYSKFKDLQDLPEPKKIKDFKKSLLQSENCIRKISNNKIMYKTPVGEIEIYIPYAYLHFSKDGKFGNRKENRYNLTGALNLILDKPAFVAKDASGTLYFYKPFLLNNEFKDVISISIDKKGKLEYRTTYIDKYGQIKDLINQEIIYTE